MFKTIKFDASAELVEKKSKFIGNIFYVESVEEAEEKIKEINKKYFDARHNCYAFSIYGASNYFNLRLTNLGGSRFN
jgi:putative IMPACT (imprinted ancient) family translation regulator